MILAVYSGLTQEEYDLLSEIAPTVAYPDRAWSTPWRKTIEIVGEALGRSEQATELLDGIDAQVAAAAEAHPEFEGTSIIQVADTPDAFYVYKEANPRVQFLTDLGFVTAPAVTELATDESTFYFTLSKERLGELQSDVLVARARAFIVASPFVVLATSGEDGTDASPRGGPPAAACALRDHLDLDVGPDVITADLDAGYAATMWEPGG